MKGFINALLDLIRLFVPLFPSSAPGVAFIVHMRNVDDVYRKFPLFKIFPESFTLRFFRFMWPITVSHITGLHSLVTGNAIPGWIISIPLTARQMLENREYAKRKILQAVRVAEHRGARLASLGALTASLTHGGTYIADRTPVVVTTGHAYTVHNVTQTVLNIMQAVGRTPGNTTLAIVGANGSIGSNCARVLARSTFKKILLVDIVRRSDGLDELCDEVKNHCQATEVIIDHRISSIKEADIIIAATNAPEALIRADDLKSGTVVVDDAQPTDVDSSVFERDDVLVLEAGAVRTPGISANFDIDLQNSDDNYSCLVESFILAATENYEAHVLGRPTLEQIDTMGSEGARLGFRTANFQNMFGLIDEKKIAHIRSKQV